MEFANFVLFPLKNAATCKSLEKNNIKKWALWDSNVKLVMFFNFKFNLACFVVLDISIFYLQLSIFRYLIDDVFLYVSIL